MCYITRLIYLKIKKFNWKRKDITKSAYKYLHTDTWFFQSIHIVTDQKLNSPPTKEIFSDTFITEVPLMSENFTAQLQYQD